MAKRRRKSKQSSTPTRARKDKPRAPMNPNGSAACMGAPNHRVPIGSSWQTPFPLLSINLAEDESEGGICAFRDQRYGSEFFDWPSTLAPPTWMDPEVFVALAREDPDIIKVLDQGLKQQNSETCEKKLMPLLETAFDSYLNYVVNNWDEVKHLVAEWMVCNHAELQVIAETKEELLRDAAKSRKRKRLAAADDITEADLAEDEEEE